MARQYSSKRQLIKKVVNLPTISKPKSSPKERRDSSYSPSATESTRRFALSTPNLNIMWTSPKPSPTSKVSSSELRL